jgi:hypothetical protein
MDRSGRVSVSARPARAAGVLTTMALAVAGVPMVSAGAGTRDTTVMRLQLAGGGEVGARVEVRAVSNDGELGAAQRSVVASTARTARTGTAALRADPGALAGFADGTGYVNFEAMTVVGGAPRFASFSRRWTGVAWVDRNAVPAARPVTISTAEPTATAKATNAPAMTHVRLDPAAAASSEVPCYWYDDSVGKASTKIGEYHTGRNTSGDFAYGRGADSDISVGYNYGSSWSLGGTGHVGNSRATAVVFDRKANFHRQLRSYFDYVHWHLTLGPSCASSKNFGKRYTKVTPSKWVGGSAEGATIKGPFCRGSKGRVPNAPNTHFYRGDERAYTYGGAASPWGAGVSATSGYSTRVDMHWKFGSSRKVRHWLCGTPNINESKIVYAA